MNNQLFSTLAALTIDELSAMDDNLSKIEFVRRKEREVDILFELQFNDLFELLFAVYTAGQFDQAHSIIEKNVDNFYIFLHAESRFSVYGFENEWLAFAILLEKFADGPIALIASNLAKLQTVNLKYNSRLCTNLKEQGFTEQELMHLNRAWSTNISSSLLLAKEIESLLVKESQLSLVEQNVYHECVEQVIKSHNAYTFKSYTNDCRATELDTNWELALDLLRRGIINPTSPLVRVFPTIASDKNRFSLLDLKEKYFYVGISLSTFKTKEDLIEFLEEKDIMDFLKADFNQYPLEIQNEAVRLQVITLQDLTEENLLAYIRDIPNKESYDYCMTHDVEWDKVLTFIQKYSTYFYHNVNFKRDFLDKDETRLLFDKVCNFITQKYPDRKYQFLIDVLSNEFDSSLFTREEKIEFLEFIQQTREVSTYMLESMEANIYTEEECQAIKKKRDAKLKRQRNLLQKKSEEEGKALIEETFNDVTDILELDSILEDFSCGNYNAHIHLANKVVALLDDMIANLSEVSENNIKVFYDLYTRYGEVVLTITAILQRLSKLNEVIGGAKNE